MNIYRELLKPDLSDCKDVFDRLGLCIYGEQLVQDDVLVGWTHKLTQFNGFIHNTSVGSMGEQGDYLVVDGEQTFELLDGLTALYEEFKPIVSFVGGKDVVSSPYPLSIVNAKVYRQGASQGLHYDTQPITCLLFVSHGAPLEIQLLNGEWVTIHPIPGHIAIFQGRECAHRVARSEDPQFRVTVPMNYYYEDDLWRPDWIDDAVYKNQDFVSA